MDKVSDARLRLLAARWNGHRPAGPGDRPEFVGNVSDALLRLLAFRWNAPRRAEGPRRQKSLWQTLGLIDKEDARGWVERLHDPLPDE
jgi:hypothetical protein